jgi:hypothetical protein
LKVWVLTAWIYTQDGNEGPFVHSIWSTKEKMEDFLTGQKAEASLYLGLSNTPCGWVVKGKSSETQYEVEVVELDKPE